MGYIWFSSFEATLWLKFDLIIKELLFAPEFHKFFFCRSGSNFKANLAERGRTMISPPIFCLQPLVVMKAFWCNFHFIAIQISCSLNTAEKKTSSVVHKKIASARKSFFLVTEEVLACSRDPSFSYITVHVVTLALVDHIRMPGWTV